MVLLCSCDECISAQCTGTQTASDFFPYIVCSFKYFKYFEAPLYEGTMKVHKNEN